MTCYERDEDAISQSARLGNDNETADNWSDWNKEPAETVVISETDANNFQCKEFPEPIFDEESNNLIFPTLKQVSYVTNLFQMSCCSM